MVRGDASLPDFDDLSDGQGGRIDCPSCGGKGTFTATRVEGVLLYNCYKAGCSLRGRKDGLLPTDHIKSKIYNNTNVSKDLEFTIPDHFSIYFPDKMIKYCAKNNIDTSKIQLYYDVKLDRAVFPITWSNKIVDAVGRSLSRYGSKWHRYSNTGLPFIAGTSETCYVVEDAASAVAIMSHGTGLALLGTNLSSKILDIIVSYPHVIVCLDRDASAKAIQMKNRIGQFTRSEVRLLRVDPKENPEGVL